MGQTSKHGAFNRSQRLDRQAKPIQRHLPAPDLLQTRNEDTGNQLHVFSDASELALASVAYLRTRYDDDTTELKFVIGKARVAPINRMTIPNLELQAAKNGAKLSRFIKEQHDIRIDSTTLWTDSTTVLHWINSPNQRHRIFIANRLNFIMDSTSSLDWRYVPSKDNTADDGTRGYKACDMTTDSLWIKGPDFLLRPSSDWPNHPPTQLTADIHLTDNDSQPPTSVIDFNQFSTWTRALRVTSYVLLFAENIKRKTRQSLSLQHLTLGFAWIIKHSRNQSLPKEIACLTKKSDLPPRSPLQPLCPFIDDHGYLRAKRRLQKAPLLLCSRHPVILNAENYPIQLFMKQTHEINSHCGKEHTRSIVQQDFWIIRSRKHLKKTIRQCIPCRRLRQEPVKPLMADLPLQRLPLLENSYPFYSTGIDFFGPFATQNNDEYSKRYVLFFTYLVTRAVHSEICQQIDTNSTQQATRRFIARRGKPRIIFSDNGKAFVAADKDLQENLSDIQHSNEVNNQCQLLGITWKFNPPAAPHFGGSWERLIKTFKIAFYKVIGTRTLDEETLSTFTGEVEAMMNSRPLTHVSSDPTDDPYTQSPSTRTTNKQFASRIVSPSPHNGQENLETSSSLESTVLEQIPQRLLANLDDPNEMDKASGKSCKENLYGYWKT